MTRGRIALFVGLAFLALVAAWIYDNVTLEEVRIPAAAKGEAARNDLYALERLLDSLGADATSRFGYSGPPAGPAKGSVLFLPTPRRSLSASRHKALLDWVRAGGHLVVVAYTIAQKGDPPDPVLDAAGLEQTIKTRDDDGEGTSAIDSDDCPAHRESGSGPRRFAGSVMRLCFDVRFNLVPTREPLWTVSSGTGGTHAVSVALGAGKVSVLTDYGISKNADIGNADHADFMVAMLGSDVSGLRVTLIPDEDLESLLVLAWRHGPTVLAILALLALAAIWVSAARFGPVSPPLQTGRRSIVEHIEALGGFLWRRQAGEALWRATLDRTRKVIERKLPPFADDPAMVAHLAQRLRQDESALQAAFRPVGHPDAGPFTQAISMLELVRRSL